MKTTFPCLSALPLAWPLSLALASAAPAQDAANMYTEGLVLEDHHTRYEGLHDVNGDGVLDAVGWFWLDTEARQIRASVSLYDGKGKVLSRSSELSSDIGTHVNVEYASGSCIGDFDGNGLLEQLVCVHDTYHHMEFSLDGEIQFLPTFPNEEPYLNGPSWSYMKYGVADFTGDGVDDFVMANTSWLELWSFVAGVPMRLQRIPYGETSHITIDVGDFTGDGLPDVAMSAVECPNNLVRIYPVSAGVIGPVIVHTMDDCGGPLDLSAGDIDLDGDDDLVLFGSTINPPPGTGWSDTSRVLEQVAPGVISVRSRLTDSGPATALADINGDGFLDGICCGGGGGTVDVFNDEPSTFMISLNDGAGNFAPSSPFPGLGSHHIAGAMDFDGDGDMDLVAGRTVLLNTTEVGATLCEGSPNSSGEGSTLFATGSASLVRNDLVLVTGNTIPGQSGVSFFGPSEAAIPMGSGLLCVANPRVRIGVAAAGEFGRITLPLDFTGPAGSGLLPGNVFHLQTWYRDPGSAEGFGLSSSMRVLLMP